ncbi:XVIPCD domain-containing protein [Stenotrophomonas maltophilia]
MPQQEQTPMGQPQPELPRYRLTQLHSPARGNQPVADLDGLVTHHPGSNARARVVDGVPVGVENPRTRSYGVVGGEIEELETRRTDGGSRSALGPDQVLLTKDFMLEDSRIAAGGRGVRSVDVPSPFSGYINRVNPALGVVDIYDRKGGELIARVLHMDPILVHPGDTVQYGQALGTQSNMGLPNAGKHVHLEVDTRYFQQYGNYVEDLASGRLSIDPGRRDAGIEPRAVVDDGIIRIGESADIVRVVQQRLNAAGYRGADGQPLAEDGVYRLSMQKAVINYQEAQQLPRSGDLDPATLQRIAPAMLPPTLHPTTNQPGLPYPNLQGSADSVLHAAQPPLLAQAQDAVLRMEAGRGRPFDAQSGCLAASAACLARDSGLSRIDHVLLSEPTSTTRRGETVFVVQGDLADPSHRRAQMSTASALATPVEESLQRLQERPPAVGIGEPSSPQAELQAQDALRARSQG